MGNVALIELRLVELTRAHRRRLEVRELLETTDGKPRRIPVGHLVRDTPGGRQRIAEALARLELGIDLTSPPAIPTRRADDPRPGRTP